MPSICEDNSVGPWWSFTFQWSHIHSSSHSCCTYPVKFWQKNFLGKFSMILIEKAPFDDGLQLKWIRTTKLFHRSDPHVRTLTMALRWTTSVASTIIFSNYSSLIIKACTPGTKLFNHRRMPFSSNLIHVCPKLYHIYAKYFQMKVRPFMYHSLAGPYHQHWRLSLSWRSNYGGWDISPV